MTDSISTCSCLQHAKTQQHLGILYSWKQNVNFRLWLHRFSCRGLGVRPQGGPSNSPRLSQGTGREKCATEWKSQHSQPFQIAIESIYSTLGKTCNQALIISERVRQKVLLGPKIQGKKINTYFHLASRGVWHQLWPLYIWCGFSDLNKRPSHGKR